MKLKKAIEILTNDLNKRPAFKNRELDYAEKLGIEALKRCELARKETSFVGPGLLPSETKD